MSILENPAIRNLKPETKRERYLHFKAYVEGFEAALGSVAHFGLEEAQVIHQHAMANVKLPESMAREESTMFSELVTPRLVLRPLRLSDSAAVFAYRSDPEVARFQMWEPQDVKEVRSFIEGLLDREPDAPGTWYQLAITLRESGVLIGDCGLHFPMEGPDQVEVGITLAPAHQGQGYATEALEGMMEYPFVSLGKHRVYARVDPRNEASIALLERVGMRKEGHLRESAWVKGEWADDVIYAILEKEWKSRRRRG